MLEQPLASCLSSDNFFRQRVTKNGAADVICAVWHYEMWCVPSGAVCYTGACCRLYAVGAHRAVWEQANWSIVVLLVTLCFCLHVNCGSLQRIVYTVVPCVTLWVYDVCPVVPFVALGLVVNPSLLTEVTCVFTCSNVWCRLLHTWHACVEQICDWLYGSKQL